MSKNVSAYGRFLRKLRIDFDQHARDMATVFEVSPSFLSAVEYGKRKIPTRWRSMLIDVYQLSVDDQEILDSIMFDARLHEPLVLDHLSQEDKALMFNIAKQLPNVNESVKSQLHLLFKNTDT